VIGVNNDIRVHDVRSEFFESEYHLATLFP
jgi:hypothetical protein